MVASPPRCCSGRSLPCVWWQYAKKRHAIRLSSTSHWHCAVLTVAQQPDMSVWMTQRTPLPLVSWELTETERDRLQEDGGVEGKIINRSLFHICSRWELLNCWLLVWSRPFCCECLTVELLKPHGCRCKYPLWIVSPDDRPFTNVETCLVHLKTADLEMICRRRSGEKSLGGRWLDKGLSQWCKRVLPHQGRPGTQRGSPFLSELLSVTFGFSQNLTCFLACWDRGNVFSVATKAVFFLTGPRRGQAMMRWSSCLRGCRLWLPMIEALVMSASVETCKKIN